MVKQRYWCGRSMHDRHTIHDIEITECADRRCGFGMATKAEIL